jgi:uncharacterized membrane protein YwzB
MLDLKRVSAARENTLISLARFSGLDQLDCLMIVVAVLLGTIAKHSHFLGLPDWLLEWVSPFLLMAAGYWARQKITELIEVRRIRGPREK